MTQTNQMMQGPPQMSYLLRFDLQAPMLAQAREKILGRLEQRLEVWLQESKAWALARGQLTSRAQPRRG